MAQSRLWTAGGTAWLRRAQALLLVAGCVAVGVGTARTATARPASGATGAPPGQVTDEAADLAFQVLAVLRPCAAAIAAVLCWAASRRRRSSDRRHVTAWRLLAGACAALAVGDTVTLLAGPGDAVVLRLLPPSSPADVILLTFYPLTLTAVWLLLRSDRPRWRPLMWWDGAVVAVAGLAAGATLLHLLTHHGPAGAAGLGGSGFAVADLAALALLLALVAINRSLAPVSLWWVASALGVLAAADLQAVVLPTASAADGGDAAAAALTSLGVLASTVLLGQAAPDRGHDRRVHDWFGRARGGRHSERFRAAMLPGLAVLVAGLVVLAGLFAPAASPWVSATGLLAIALALARLAITVGTTAGADPTTATATDDVTGLANRRALSEALREEGEGSIVALSADPDRRGAVTERSLALLLVDLDRFKDVNDALGHEAGDRLLAAVGDRFTAALHEGQLLARLGGDEFAVVIPDAGTEAVSRVAQALHAALEPPFALDGSRLHVRASIGAAVARLPRDDPADLLRRADVAMYRAKGDGGGGLRFSTAGPDTDGHDRLRRIDELRQALDRGDIAVHVQPQVSLRRGQIVAVEALARWRHPEDGVLLPQAFLPLAAATGLVRPVARTIVDAALGACAQWWHAGHELPVAVNLTAEDLTDDGSDDGVEGVWAGIRRALARHELPGEALHIELTEESLLRDPARTARLLQTARAAGVKIALDDYGTGYSSLAYLRQLPVDVLKLDQVFARHIAQRTTTTIVRHTVAMAHGLGLRVVAEGIEDEAAARALTDLGCDIGQGRFFHDALTPEDFLEVLRGRPLRRDPVAGG